MQGKEKNKPEIGMSFSEAKDKLKKLKIAQHNPATRSSLINQVKLREGEASAKALEKETQKYFKTEKVLNALNSGNSVSHSEFGIYNGWGKGTLNKGNDLQEDGFVKVSEGRYKISF